MGRYRTVQALQQKNHVYRGRREKYRKKYGYNSLEYKKINSKICTIYQLLSRRYDAFDKIRVVDYLIEDFIGVRPSKEIKEGRGTRKIFLARNIFYKFLLENGVRGRQILEYMKADVNAGLPTRQRLRFTRSFKTNKDNLELWRRFKSFVADYKEDVDKVKYNSVVIELSKIEN